MPAQSDTFQPQQWRCDSSETTRTVLCRTQNQVHCIVPNSIKCTVLCWTQSSALYYAQLNQVHCIVQNSIKCTVLCRTQSSALYCAELNQVHCIVLNSIKCTVLCSTQLSALYCAELNQVHCIVLKCRPCDVKSSQSPSRTASRWQPSVPWTSHACSCSLASRRSPAAVCNAGTLKTQLKQHILSHLCCSNVFQHDIISLLKAADLLHH